MRTGTHAHTHSSQQASCGPLRDPQFIVIYSPFTEIYVWAYGTIYSHQQEVDLYLWLLPAVFVVMMVVYKLLLRVRIRACWRLTACSRVCLRAYMIACSIACLRELGFERSRVSTGSFWPMANSQFVEALANRTL